MSKPLIASILYIFFKTPEEIAIANISKALCCEIKFVDENEKGTRIWIARNLGFVFQITWSKMSDQGNYFTFNASQSSNFFPKEKSSIISLDFHFKDLFHDAGFEQVMTVDEFKPHLQEASHCI
jgi:hypothetical protein